MAQGCPCSLVTTLQLTTITYITPHSTLNDTASSQKSTGGPGHRCSFNFSYPFLGEERPCQIQRGHEDGGGEGQVPGDHQGGRTSHHEHGGGQTKQGEPPPLLPCTGTP